MHKEISTFVCCEICFFCPSRFFFPQTGKRPLDLAARPAHGKPWLFAGLEESPPPKICGIPMAADNKPVETMNI